MPGTGETPSSSSDADGAIAHLYRIFVMHPDVADALQDKINGNPFSPAIDKPNRFRQLRALRGFEGLPPEGRARIVTALNWYYEVEEAKTSDWHS